MIRIFIRNVLTADKTILALDVNPFDKIETIIKKVKTHFNIPSIIKTIFGFYEKFVFYFLYNSHILKENTTFYEEGFKNNDIIRLIDLPKGAGPIDNLKNEEAKDIGFDMNLIKKK